MNKLQDGPGSTKNVANHDEVRRARKAAQKRNSSGTRRVLTQADHDRIQQEKDNRQAATNTINALTFKLLKSPEVLKVAEFLLETFTSTRGRKIGGRYMKPLDIALLRSREKFDGVYSAGIINTANRAVREELGYQLNQL